MKIGILGGGQLARMLILAGKPLGIDFVVFTPKLSSCTENLAQHVIAELDDIKALDSFAEQVDVITYETENIPVAAVDYLNQHKPVFPGSDTLAITQDRLKEKELFKELAVPTNQFFAIDSASALHQAAELLGLPFMLKSRRGGYDGKYHYRIDSQKSIDDLIAKNNLTGHIAEAFVAFEREISTLAVVARDGEIACYDICENRHTDGILHKTFNRPNDPMAETALRYLNKIASGLPAYAGTIAVEFFVKGQGLLANEIAPRVHNSGHWTIDACYTSQFENHLRAIAGLPLGDTASFAECEMTNIIGCWPDRKQLFNTPALSIHDYQKEPRAGRKLGHITKLPDR